MNCLEKLGLLAAVETSSCHKTRARPPGVHAQCLDNRLRPCGTVGVGALVFAQAGVGSADGVGAPGHSGISHGLTILCAPERCAGKLVTIIRSASWAISLKHPQAVASEFHALRAAVAEALAASSNSGEVCVYVCVYIYIYIYCLYIYMYVCICIYTHTSHRT